MSTRLYYIIYIHILHIIFKQQGRPFGDGGKETNSLYIIICFCVVLYKGPTKEAIKRLQAKGFLLLIYPTRVTIKTKKLYALIC